MPKEAGLCISVENLAVINRAEWHEMDGADPTLDLAHISPSPHPIRRIEVIDDGRIALIGVVILLGRGAARLSRWAPMSAHRQAQQR
jgi:hypothetical protein